MSYLDQGSNDTQAGQTQVLKRSGLAGSVQERVQEQWDVGWNMRMWNAKSQQC